MRRSTCSLIALFLLVVGIASHEMTFADHLQAFLQFKIEASPALKAAEVALGELGFCVFPSLVLTGQLFFRYYVSHFGYDESTFDLLHGQANKVRKATDFSQVVIPFKSHMVWLTTAASPVEFVQKEHVAAMAVQSMAAFDRSTSEKWVHTLWTRDASLQPRTAEWCKKHGIVLRELKSLAGYSDTYD